ncbi:S8 family serine peptidase [Microbulbifer sp. ALW1]|uniref:S8 family serine peptidase n=1 Tax=Microbulbifer sp. (strain ALW1) TaxID=1516059 RepID=UPI001358D06E|nr:S8 family serine peptidase [Microbulbifer sp. ALW1]
MTEYLPGTGLRRTLLAAAVLVSGALSTHGTYASELAVDIEPAAEAVEPVTANGKLVRFIELSSKPLAEAGVNPNRKAAYLKKLAQEQSDFRAQAKAAGIAFTERKHFDVLFNGLSIEVSAEDLAKLEALDLVNATYPIYEVMSGTPPVPAKVPEGTTRENVTVTNLTGVPEAHAAGITGKGVVVGVIDSGIDYNHRAFGGPGFPNSKVIGGYDFADNDPDPFDDQYGAAEMHGTHVSGIVAGNDDIMVGVAPDAKLRAYRIFGTQNRGATEDVLIAAMEQAVEDGCDVVNMSWGSNRAEVIQNGLMARAADRMLKSGTVPVVAIGNSNAGPFLPGAPAIAKQAIAVGGAYDETRKELAFELSNSETVPFRVMYNGAAVPGAGSFPIVDAGVANCQPIPEGVSYEGNVVLLKRGHYTCRTYTAINQFAEAGAEAVIWWQSSYNPESWPGQWNSTKTPLEIPTVIVRTMDGEKIAAMSPGASLDWGHYFDVPGDFGGLTGFFSSWGPSHELELKPDVMAPGGNIFSTVPNYAGDYGVMTGTSMAAPHVAGIAALMLSSNPKLKAHEVREILLSSSTPTRANFDTSLGLQPVAQQGAGMVNALAAIASEVKALPAKISLQDLRGTVASEQITIENKSSKAVTYTLRHNPAISVAPPMTAFWNPSTATADVTFSAGTLTVPADGEASFTASFREPGELPGGSILSGWIELVPEAGDTLRVPYLGLKGAYQELPALNPTFTDINPGLDNPSLRPETRPYCDGPPPTQARCCSDPTPGSCGWSIGKSTPLTLDFTNGDKYDDAAFAMISQGFPMLRKYRARVINEAGQTVAWAKDRYTGLRPAKLFEHWVRNSGAGTGIDFAQWDGVLEDGAPAPAGTYYIRLEFDKLGGDGVSFPDFETWTSPPITVVR